MACSLLNLIPMVPVSGNHEVMMRGTFANVRIKNQLAKQEGGYTTYLPTGEEMTVFDASMKYQEASTDAGGSGWKRVRFRLVERLGGQRYFSSGRKSRNSRKLRAYSPQ